MVFGLDSCQTLIRIHLTVCSSPKRRPRIFQSSAVKHLSKAMGGDAFGEEETPNTCRPRLEVGVDSVVFSTPFDLEASRKRRASVPGCKKYTHPLFVVQFEAVLTGKMCPR